MFAHESSSFSHVVWCGLFLTLETLSLLDDALLLKSTMNIHILLSIQPDDLHTLELKS